MGTTRIMEGILLNEKIIYTKIEFIEICTLSPAMFEQMIEHGIIEPLLPSENEQFDAHALIRAKKALRLQQDLSINWEGISLILDLLEKIEVLEQELGYRSF